MNLNELIARLEALRDQYGGELGVIYDGIRSPINGAVYLPGNPYSLRRIDLIALIGESEED